MTNYDFVSRSNPQPPTFNWPLCLHCNPNPRSTSTLSIKQSSDPSTRQGYPIAGLKNKEIKNQNGIAKRVAWITDQALWPRTITLANTQWNIRRTSRRVYFGRSTRCASLAWNTYSRHVLDPEQFAVNFRGDLSWHWCSGSARKRRDCQFGRKPVEVRGKVEEGGGKVSQRVWGGAFQEEIPLIWWLQIVFNHENNESYCHQSSISFGRIYLLSIAIYCFMTGGEILEVWSSSIKVFSMVRYSFRQTSMCLRLDRSITGISTVYMRSYIRWKGSADGKDYLFCQHGRVGSKTLKVCIALSVLPFCGND